MGDPLTGEDGPKPQSQTPYGDVFDELLPHYLAMGMSYDDYWDGEYGMKTACRKAYQIRIENDQRRADLNMWYMGQYVISALRSTQLIVAAGLMKNTPTLPDYPDKPFLEKAEEQKKEEARKQHEEDQSRLAMALFQAMASKFNQNVEKRLAKEKGSGQ